MDGWIPNPTGVTVSPRLALGVRRKGLSRVV